MERIQACHSTERESQANNPSCTKCHSGWGFIRRVDPIPNDRRPSSGFPQISCAVCHDQHRADLPSQVYSLAVVTFGDSVTVVNYGGMGKVCMQCHISRRDAEDYTNNAANLSTNFGPHHSNQADMIDGSNAIEYGIPIGTSGHKFAVTDACVTCHMQATPAAGQPGHDKIGEHTFAMSWDNGTPDNPADDVQSLGACQQCHGPIKSFDDILAKADFEWKNRTRRAEIKLGRQPVFAGAGVGTIDGAQLKWRAARWLRLKAFGGGLLPADQRLQIVDDLDKNYMAGGQAVIEPSPDLNIGLSYSNKHQLRSGYTTQRADSIGNVFTLYVEPTDRAYEYTSLDASWQVKRTSFHGRSDYDMLDDQFTRAEFSMRSEISPKVLLNGSYTFRSPRLPWNSIFAAFNVEDNQEVEGGLYYSYKPSLRFYGNVAGIFYSDDESFRFTVGSECNFGVLSFVHRSGYAGNLNGVNASLYYPLQQGKITPSALLSWASYKLDASATSQSLFSGAAGLLVRPLNILTIDSQLQYLHNRFYSNDVRFLVRLQYWFFKNVGTSN